MDDLNYGSVSTVNFGLAAASFAGLLAMLQVNQLDTYLMISLVCFAVIMPINLIVGLSTSPHLVEAARRYPHISRLAKASMLITPMIALIGMVCLILHFSIAVGVVFVIVTLVTFSVFAYAFGDK